MIKEIIDYIRSLKNRITATIKDYLCRFIFLFVRKRYRNTKYYFSICCIFKNEARYFKEWLEFHRIIGVDHIYAYNNDSDDNFHEVLKPYIDEGYVTLIDFPGQYAQFPAYAHCYNNYGQETYWLSYVDLDEFIVPKTHTNIKDWIKPYEKYPSVVFYWLMFGTNGIVESSSDKLVIEQFTNSFKSIRNTGKIALNTSFEPVKMYHHFIYCWMNVLGIKIKIPTIDEHKKFVFFYSNHKVNKHYTVQMNHYWSKSLSDYVKKIDKGDMVDKKHDEIRKQLDFFFWHEHQNVSEDRTIFRFLIELKIRLNGIKIIFKNN